VPGSDYINANIVHHEHKFEAICSQAPLPNTFDDFWRMVWEQVRRCFVVDFWFFPLCRSFLRCLHEPHANYFHMYVIDVYIHTGCPNYRDPHAVARKRQSQGAPLLAHLLQQTQAIWRYHNFIKEGQAGRTGTEPLLNSQDLDGEGLKKSFEAFLFNVKPPLTFSPPLLQTRVRVFQLTKTFGHGLTAHTSSRRIVQLHFKGWPDQGVPDSTRPIRELVHLMQFYRQKAAERSLRGPVLVHCSAGIGRTGTFLAIVFSLEKMNELSQQQGTMRNGKRSNPSRKTNNNNNSNSNNPNLLHPNRGDSDDTSSSASNVTSDATNTNSSDVEGLVRIQFSI
jgi:hypothetical protein